MDIRNSASTPVTQNESWYSTEIAGKSVFGLPCLPDRQASCLNRIIGYWQERV